MKHQWSQPADTWVCDACGLTVPFLSVLVRADADASVLVDLGGVVTGECPATKVAGEYVELSTEVLTRITEDLWLNPAHVAAAQIAQFGNPMSSDPFKDDPRYTNIYMTDGKYHAVNLPLHEVVALLNGSA